MTTQAEAYLKATAAKRRADLREDVRSFLGVAAVVGVVLVAAALCAVVCWWLASQAAISDARTKAEVQAIQAAGNAPAQVAPVQAPVAVDPAAAPKFTVVETTVHGILFYVLVTEKGGQVSTCLLGAGVTQFAVPLEGDPKTWKDQLPKHGDVRTVAPGDTK